MNFIIFISAVIIFLFAVVLIYKLFGKSGIYVYICFATILANLQVCKSIEIFGIATTAAPVLYASNFLCTDILSEKHGKKAAAKAVWLGVFITVLWVIGTQITLLFKPSAADYVNESMKVLFSLAPRVSIASLIAYAVSQRIDVAIYHAIWKATGENKKCLWLRNNGSTLSSQLVDTVLFVTIAFVGTMPANILIQIYLTTYLFKAIVALCDTPFIYLARKIGYKED